MSTSDKRDPRERGSTDESLRSERRKTDAELARRAGVTHDAASDVIAEARNKADHVLSDARDKEDQGPATAATATERTDERAREDEAIKCARSGADADERDESERRRLALAKLLAFEREDTDLRLEIERERADEALTTREDFMAMVSHDLRALLGGIALSAELLKGVDTSDQPAIMVTKYAERIQRFSARMNRLIGDLMDVASIDAGKLTLCRVRRNAALLLNDAVDAFEPAARVNGISLSCSSVPEPCMAEFDHDRILQVLGNLVGNAFKFTPRGGKISIRCERRNDEACFAVSDNGQGIPRHHLEKVFTRYFQALGGDRRGLGLGLFISRSIIEGHGGRIWAESTLDKGSTFFFTLPLIATDRASA